MPEKLVEVKDVEISFGEGSKKFVAVHNANFFINKGETFSLVGESGSDKTTIGRAIIGLNDTSNGEIIFDGKKINGHLSHSEKNDLIRRIQMIFQDPAASLNERATVDYILSEGLHNFHLYKDEEDRKAKIKKIIKEVGLLEEHLTRYPHDISDRIAVIYKGTIVEVAETEELYNNPIHPYTKSLLSAVPIPDPILERKKVLKVYNPNQHDYSVDKPEMVEVRPGHFVWGNKAEIETYRKEQSK